MKDTAHQEKAESAAADLSVRPLIIGVAGGTGSGKTTIARKLKESYPPHCVQVIAQDSYYKIKVIYLLTSGIRPITIIPMRMTTTC